MKCQNLFSWKTLEKYFKMASVKNFTQSVKRYVIKHYDVKNRTWFMAHKFSLSIRNEFDYFHI